MNPLTDDIRQQIGQGWRVGVEREDGILVYDIRARIGNTMRGDEVWYMHKKSSGKKGGRAIMESNIFTEVRMEDVCYCYNQRLGSHYIIDMLAEEF